MECGVCHSVFQLFHDRLVLFHAPIDGVELLRSCHDDFVVGFVALGVHSTLIDYLNCSWLELVDHDLRDLLVDCAEVQRTSLRGDGECSR